MSTDDTARPLESAPVTDITVPAPPPVAGQAPGGSSPSEAPYGYGPAVGGQPPVSGPATGTAAYGQPFVPSAPVAPSGPRVGTVVWGLVLVALGAGVVGIAAGARLDVGLAAIIVLAGAGVALLVGSLLAGLRRDRHRA